MNTTTRQGTTTVTVTARLSDDARALVAQSEGWPDITKRIAVKGTNKGTEVKATFRASASVSIAEWQRLAARLAHEAA